MDHSVKFVSMINGDDGNYKMGGGQLAKHRMVEEKEAGKRFGLEYVVIDNHDGELMLTLENRLKIICEIRKLNADIVITHRPNDYHPDNRNPALLVQDAAYLITVPNVAREVPTIQKNPVFLYTKHRFQNPTPFRPDIAVIINLIFDQKIYTRAANESQYFEWLPWTSWYFDKVPEDEASRLEFLACRRI